jgi:hypothetical protein
MKTPKSKYLVRPKDYTIFEVDYTNGCYRCFSDKYKRNRFHAYKHFTFENLTQNYGFLPITEADIPTYKKLAHTYWDIMKKYTESDGHGGCKGTDNLTFGEMEFLGL